MNRHQNHLLIACGLTMSIFSASSLAQVAPPPTEPSEQPTYTPAPKAKPAPKPQAKPTQPMPQEGMQIRKRDGDNAEDLPTNVPYPKLAQPGPDGRILRLRQLPDILAMRSNPNIGPAAVERIMPLIHLRRNKMETAVIDNLDLYWELTGGMIENLNMADINEMGRAADMIKPLVPEVTLSQDMLNRNLLTRVQGGMNKYIVREYKKAVTDEIQVLDGDKGLEEVMRFVLDDSMHEARLAYEGLLVELMGRAEEIIALAEVDSSASAELAKIDAKPSANPEEQFEQIRAFDDAFRKLSYDDAMNIFNAMRSTREFENVSPTIATIDVLHERKKVLDTDAFGAKMVDKRTGETVYNSNEKRKEIEAEKQKKAAQTEPKTIDE